jgi:hypothetical protein
MNTTTQPGVASKQPDPDVNADEIPVDTRSPREIALESMGERQEEARRAHIDEGLAGDEGAAAIQAQLVNAQAANRAEAEAEGLLEPLEEDGAASVEPMHEPAPAPVNEALPEELQNDPLAEYIVMDDDKPMFVTKINGENVLVPLDDARRRLQIRVAAEVDMKNAREFKKTLDSREQALSAGEAAFQARMSAAPVQTPAAPTVEAGMSEKEIAAEARAFVGSAFSDDEDTAADKLTKLLLKTRTPAQVMPAAAPQVDVQGIVRQATENAVQAIDHRDQQTDLVEGINTFETEYPEIVGDAHLYGMADTMTDDIAIEHPEWPKSQVMMEAGKRTRKWVKDLKGTGTTVEDEDPVTTDDVTISEPVATSETQNRLERKQGLVRLPKAATAAVQTSQEEPVRQQTAAEALAETRAARGQPA